METFCSSASVGIRSNTHRLVFSSIHRILTLVAKSKNLIVCQARVNRWNEKGSGKQRTEYNDTYERITKVRISRRQSIRLDFNRDGVVK